MSTSSDAREGKQPASDSGSDTKTNRGFSRWIRAQIPQWLSIAVRKPRVWKVWIRCMVATFGSLVIMLAQPSLQVLGQAAFFGVIMSQVIPPYFAMGMFVLAIISTVLGLCLGWAWGCAAMAAALKTRDLRLILEQIVRTAAGIDAQYNIEDQFQSRVFNGDFLEPRSSAVYGVFLFFGCYFFGYIRAKIPMSMLISIYGTIILDVMCSYGPLFPLAQYTLAKTLITPAATYMAVALATSILIFPESLNHIVLNTIVEDSLVQCRNLLSLQDRVLQATDPGDWERLSQETKVTRTDFSQSVKQVQGQIKLLQLEVTRGRTSAADLTMLFGKLKELGGRAYGMSSFVMLLDQRAKGYKRLEAQGEAFRTKRRLNDYSDNDVKGTDYASLLPILESSTAPLRKAASEAITESIHFLDSINRSRWTSPKNQAPTEVREQRLVQLRSALHEFRSEDQFRLLDNYSELFDEKTGEPKQSIPALTHASRNLFRCQVFMTTLSGFCEVLAEWLEMILELEKRNPKAKFQFPGGVTKAVVEVAGDKEGVNNPMDMGAERVDEAAVSTTTLVETRIDQEKKGRSRTYRKDPDASDPTNVFQKIGRVLYRVWRFLASTEGIFALKYAIVSIALWIPAVAPASAGFNYDNKGLWALIMAQTGLGVFTGEQVFSFISRTAATIIGLVVGMVIWYIGAGNGKGNPYGIAAAFMVFTGPFLFFRINSPIYWQGFYAMIPVTIAFIVGYSWVDGYVYQVANQGVGASLSGRRALLVIIGFVAGSIVMLFPKPVSAKTRVRLNLARITADLGDLYGSEISGFELEMEKGKQISDSDIRARQAIYRGVFSKIFARYQTLLPQMAFARWEPGLKGPWPARQYEHLVECLGHIINALALLSGAYGHMDRTWAKRLAENADTLHPSFIADTLSMFSLLHSSLKHAQPLPPTIPLFERLFYHHESKHALREARGIPGSKTGKSGENHSLPETGNEEERLRNLESQESEMVQALGDSFNFNTLRDEQFALYATANVALVHLTNSLNELHLTVRDLVGEKELEGFQVAQERWAGLERES